MQEKIRFDENKRKWDSMLQIRKIQLGVSDKNKKNVEMKVMYDYGFYDSEFGIMN